MTSRPLHPELARLEDLADLEGLVADALQAIPPLAAEIERMNREQWLLGYDDLFHDDEPLSQAKAAASLGGEMSSRRQNRYWRNVNQGDRSLASPTSIIYGGVGILLDIEVRRRVKQNASTPIVEALGSAGEELAAPGADLGAVLHKTALTLREKAWYGVHRLERFRGDSPMIELHDSRWSPRISAEELALLNASFNTLCGQIHAAEGSSASEKERFLQLTGEAVGAVSTIAEGLEKATEAESSLWTLRDLVKYVSGPLLPWLQGQAGVAMAGAGESGLFPPPVGPQIAERALQGPTSVASPASPTVAGTTTPARRTGSVEEPARRVGG